MVTKRRDKRVARRTALLDKLIRQRGIERYGIFDVTTEGKELPDGSESSSGFVIDEHGQVFMFWLDQDEKTREIVFTKWRAIEPGHDWGADEEYLQARAAAGLS